MKLRNFPALALALAFMLPLLSSTAEAAKACTEVSCGATYGGANLTSVDNIEVNGENVSSWECHYSDGTTLTVTCS